MADVFDSCHDNSKSDSSSGEAKQNVVKSEVHLAGPQLNLKITKYSGIGSTCIRDQGPPQNFQDPKISADREFSPQTYKVGVHPQELIIL